MEDESHGGLSSWFVSAELVACSVIQAKYRKNIYLMQAAIMSRQVGEYGWLGPEITNREYMHMEYFYTVLRIFVVPLWLIR